MAESLADFGFDIKLSTRSTQKAITLNDTAITSYIVDIDDLSASYANFLDSTVLIINITSKNDAGFAHLISQIETSQIEQVLFISSSSVYNNVNGIVREQDNQENTDSVLYQIEQLFQSNQHFNTTVLRLSGLIGYSRHPGRFFNKPGKKINQADTPVNLIHRDDCIGIIHRIIHQGIWGDTFNACADSHPTKRDYYSAMSEQLMLPKPEVNEVTELSYKIVSNDTLKKRLNYQFIYPDVMLIPFGDNA